MWSRSLFFWMAVCIGISFQGTVGGQTPGALILSENFSDTLFPRPGWLADGVSRVTTSGSYVSAPAAASFGTYHGTLTLPATPYASWLRFQLGRTTSTVTKALIVEISTDGDLTGFVPLDTFDHSNTQTNTFILCDIDLQAFAHLPAVWLRFRKASSTTSPWRIDDVEVFTSPSLPVTLTSFTGRRLPEGSVKLQWTTATEEQNEGFVVQRGSSTGNFDDIGFLKGGGTTTQPASYAYTDTRPSHPVSYYRLIQIDQDGAQTVLPTIQVDVAGNTTAGITSVSATMDGLVVHLDADMGCRPTRYRIADLTGRVIFDETQWTEGKKIALSVKPLPGVYVLIISDSIYRVTRKFSVDF
jgi:hypothetical protein